jgi:hypothetical protein
MTEYNEKISQKNLKFNRPSSNFSNNFRDQKGFSNYNYYSSNNKENNDRIDIMNYNHDYYERINKRRADYLPNKNTNYNNFLSNNYTKNQPHSLKNNDLFRKYNSGKTTNNIFDDKNNLNPKTEKIRNSYINRDIDKLKKLGIDDNYIKNFIIIILLIEIFKI